MINLLIIQQLFAVGRLRISFLLCLLSVTACVSLQPGQPWPENIPDRKVFQRVYSADKPNSRVQTEAEYLAWVTNFYLGTSLIPISWNQIEADVLLMVVESERNHIGEQLNQLGLLISQDWSKDNGIRKVSSSMLSLWLGVMQVAADQNKQAETLEIIMRDATALLSSALLPGTITSERYEEILGISLFDDD